MEQKKRTLGIYLTKMSNPFQTKGFQKWAKKINFKQKLILEPFAGANDLVRKLQEIKLLKDYSSFDIEPKEKTVKTRDTIKSFPTGFEVCVTNPPWLAKNSATRRGLQFPKSNYDDLYKHCLDICLNNCNFVAAIIPATFLQSNLFRKRLSTVIFIQKKLFLDTENPVCLALFDKKQTEDIAIYYDNEFFNYLSVIEKFIPKPTIKKQIIINDKNGSLGLVAIDNTKDDTIRFCNGNELQDYDIKHSSRAITRISGDFTTDTKLIKELNHTTKEFRKNTKDLFLTTFKGLRADGNYRRRLDFGLAKKIINSCL